MSLTNMPLLHEENLLYIAVSLRLLRWTRALIQCIDQFVFLQPTVVLEDPALLDLNPIEHIWDMSRSIQQGNVAPQTVWELADALVQVWDEIPQETICHLIRSMPRH